MVSAISGLQVPPALLDEEGLPKVNNGMGIPHQEACMKHNSSCAAGHPMKI